MTPRTASFALVALFAVAACGGGSSPTVAVSSASASPSAPQGGPVSAPLAGAWTLVSTPTIGLNLTGTDYTIGPANNLHGGNLAVNGSEIDFYNAVTTGCYAIGRYRWDISAGLLKLMTLNPDPCERAPYLVDPKGWQRPP